MISRFEPGQVLRTAGAGLPRPELGHPGNEQ
jgi:hypothetical protein